MDFQRFRIIIKKNKNRNVLNSLNDSKNSIKIPLLNTTKAIKRNILLNTQNRTIVSSGKTSDRKKNDSTNRTINQSTSLSRTLNSKKSKSKIKIKRNPLKNPLYRSNLVNFIKYNIKIDNHPILPIKYKGLPENIIKTNKKLINNLIKENENIFDTPFSLVNKNNFSLKFQNKLLHFDQNKINNNEEIIHSFDAINIFTTHKLKVEGKIKKDETSYKKMIRSKLKGIILKAATHFKRCDLTIDELMENKLNLKPKYEKKEILNSLIQTIKDKNLILSLQIIKEYKTSVLLFDLYNQTPLHWASKRNFYQIIPKMLSYGADIDSIDFTGYTPLHLSIINNHFDTFVILILFGASPFIHDNFGNKPIDYCRDFKFVTLIKKTSILHIGRLFGKVKFFYEDLQRNLSIFIDSEYRHLLEKDCIKIVEEIFNNCIKV
jgi:hypothetical protein